MSNELSSAHALSGAYALDALDDAERAVFEQHLAGCAECRTEVAGLREAAALIAETTAVEPPPSLRDAVLAQISTVRPLPPQVPAEVEPEEPDPLPAAAQAQPEAHPQGRSPEVTRIGPGSGRPGSGRSGPARRAGRGRRTPLLLAAAAAVVVLGAGAAVWQPWTQEETTQAPTASQRVLQAPDAQSVTLSFPGGASATLTRSQELGEAVLVTEAMPPPPAGKVYQVWLDQPGAGMVSAAVMPVREDQTILLAGDAATATGAGITVEPEGGSEEPTSEPIALFDLSAEGA